MYFLAKNGQNFSLFSKFISCIVMCSRLLIFHIFVQGLLQVI